MNLYRVEISLMHDEDFNDVSFSKDVRMVVSENIRAAQDKVALYYEERKEKEKISSIEIESIEKLNGKNEELII